jgi:hypothetical protein
MTTTHSSAESSDRYQNRISFLQHVEATDNQRFKAAMDLSQIQIERRMLWAAPPNVIRQAIYHSISSDCHCEAIWLSSIKNLTPCYLKSGLGRRSIHFWLGVSKYGVLMNELKYVPEVLAASAHGTCVHYLRSKILHSQVKQAETVSEVPFRQLQQRYRLPKRRAARSI